MPRRYKKRKLRHKSRKYRKRQQRLNRQEKPSKSPAPLPDLLTIKHSSYYFNFMAETRVSNYFLVASDTTTLMKSSTEAICTSIGRWKCDTREDDDLIRVLLQTYPKDIPQLETPKGPSQGQDHPPPPPQQQGIPEDLQFTEFGQQLMRLGEIIANLQQDDPISFWSSGQLESMFRAVVPMARDAAKLKRKLRRISDSLIPDLRELRRLAAVYGLLQNYSTSSDQQPGNGTGTGENNPLEIEATGFDSVTDIELQLSTRNSSEDNRMTCLRPILQWFQSLTNIFKSRKSPSSRKSKGFIDHSKDPRTQAILNEELVTATEKPSEKALEKIASALATPKNLSVDYILDPTDAKVKAFKESTEPTATEIKVWQQIDEVRSPVESASAMTPQSDEFSDVLAPTAMTYKPHVPLQQEAMKYLNDMNSSRYNHHHQQQQPPTFQNDTFENQQKHVELQHHINHNQGEKIALQPLPVIQANVNENIKDLKDAELHNVNLGDRIPQPGHQSDSNTNSVPHPAAKVAEVLFKTNPLKLDLMMSMSAEDYGFDYQELEECGNILQKDPKEAMFEQNLNNNSRQFLINFKCVIQEMHEMILQTIEQIRTVERMWMNTTTRAAGFRNHLRLGDMLDYIRNTVRMLNDDEFNIYQQTRQDVIQSLDPVYREFHCCFIALGELTQVVSTDVLYLKSFMENMPRGDPVVYEFASNSSLGSFDQAQMPENSEEGAELSEAAGMEYHLNCPVDIQNIFS